MSKNSPSDDLPVRRIDRILAYTSLGLLVLSIGCFLAIMISTAMGMQQADYSAGLWPAVSLTVMVAPILAFVMLISVLIMSFVRRARANKGR